MIKVKSTVKMNFPGSGSWSRRRLRHWNIPRKKLRTDVKQAQVMPFKTGTLQGEGTFVDYSESRQGKVSIISNTLYARRLYFHPEYHFQTKENPNARGKWYSDWLPGGKKSDFAIDTYKRIYKGLVK